MLGNVQCAKSTNKLIGEIKCQENWLLRGKAEIVVRSVSVNKNEETTQMELRHFVETSQTVTPFSDSSGALLHHLRAGGTSTDQKRYDVLGSGF